MYKLHDMYGHNAGANAYPDAPRELIFKSALTMIKNIKKTLNKQKQSHSQSKNIHSNRIKVTT